MSNKAKDPDLMIDDAYKKLCEDEKTTELAINVTVNDVYSLIENNNRKKIVRFVFDRFYRRYLMPYEKVNPDFNSGFAQMATCCLMIEAMESFRYGWDDSMKDAKRANGIRIKGGEIFENFFNQYDEFKEFRGYGNEFYSSIRCGILHQAETKNGWIVMREGILLDGDNRIINSTIFRRRMKKCLKNYCKELYGAGIDSDTWKCFKAKTAHLIENCKHGVLI